MNLLEDARVGRFLMSEVPLCRDEHTYVYISIYLSIYLSIYIQREDLVSEVLEEVGAPVRLLGLEAAARVQEDGHRAPAQRRSRI